MRVLLLAWLLALVTPAPVVGPTIAPGGILVVDGDSISTYANTIGTPAPCANGSTHNTTCWPDQVASYYGVSLTNNAGGGRCLVYAPSGNGHCTSTSSTIYSLFASTDLSLCGVGNLFVIDIGANDIVAMQEESNALVTLPLYKADYENIIGQCLTAGQPPGSIVVVELVPIWGNAGDNSLVPVFNEMIMRVVKEFPGVRLARTYDKFLTRCLPISVCYWDSIHPGILGDTIIGEAVLSAVAP